MAKTDTIHGNVSGKIGPLIYYHLRGSDKMIIRTKPRISKSALKHHPRYEKTRLENNEFAGCVMAAKKIARALVNIKSLGDYNSFGDLVKICKVIQQSDNSNPKGRRSILISQYANLLNGFSFNRYHRFESLVRPAVNVSIDHDTGSAKLSIPFLQPYIHLFNPADQPYYRMVLGLACINDLYIPETGKKYVEYNNNPGFGQVEYSPWMDWQHPFPATDVNIQLAHWTQSSNMALLAGVGIEFGRQVGGGEINYTKYAGAGKIWG